jgi:uncharacterized protein YdhG (YjbR/CyaY superfamily)
MKQIKHLEGQDQRASAVETIDGYIAGFPSDVQAILEQIRVTIAQAAPEATEKISYQMPTFALNGNLVYFAAYKKHIGFYPTASSIEKFKNELAAHKSSKGTIQFALDQPIPFDLIARIVKFRVEETLRKAASKK